MRIFRVAVTHVRRQPVAYLALFVALTGTGVAATPLVTSARVANNSLTSLDVKNESLTTVDVRNRSLLAVDFKLGQLPKGAKGDTGATGAAGATGSVAIGAWHVVDTAGEPATPAEWDVQAINPLRFRLEGDVLRFNGSFTTAGPLAAQLWSNRTQPLFTLPVGFRPKHDQFLIAFGQSYAEFGSVYVSAASGDVTPNGSVGGFGYLTGMTIPIT